MGAPDSAVSASHLRWGIGLFFAGLLVWVLFFDSHSLLQRYYWQQELEALTRENAQLRSEIEHLRTRLGQPLTDSLVERIAREEYGMKRPGETIYRIEPK